MAQRAVSGVTRRDFVCRNGHRFISNEIWCCALTAEYSGLLEAYGPELVMAAHKFFLPTTDAPVSEAGKH